MSQFWQKNTGNTWTEMGKIHGKRDYSLKLCFGFQNHANHFYRILSSFEAKCRCLNRQTMDENCSDYSTFKA